MLIGVAFSLGFCGGRAGQTLVDEQEFERSQKIYDAATIARTQFCRARGLKHSSLWGIRILAGEQREGKRGLKRCEDRRVCCLVLSSFGAGWDGFYYFRNKKHSESSNFKQAALKAIGYTVG